MEFNNEEFARKENNLKKGLAVLAAMLVLLILGYFAG